MKGNMIKKLLLIALLLPTFLFGEFKVRDVTVNMLSEPLGTPLEGNIVSWKSFSDVNATKQVSYRLLLVDDSGKTAYDSGEIESELQLHISIPVKLTPATKYTLTVSVKNNRDEVAQEKTFFISGIEDWGDAQWIRAEDKMRSPFLKSEMKLASNVKKVFAYVCGLGIHEFYINGKKADDRVLEPTQTNYEKYAFYSTYDITKFVKKGANDLRLWIGDGFYYQDKVWGEHHLYYNFAMAKVKIIVVYDNGKTEEFLSSDDNWEYSASPLSWANFHEGDDYDANKEGVYDWKPVIIASGKDIPERLVPPNIQPMKVVDTVTIKDVWKSENGYMIDMGQNLVGFAEFKTSLPKDKQISLYFAEYISVDKMNLDWSSTGIGATKVKQRINYISNGKKDQVYQNRFCYFGFRYIEVIGLDEAPSKDFLKGLVVHTAMPKVGEFECSNSNLNKMHEMFIWTIRGNTQGVLTDCPVREKCGWAVANSLAEAIIYNYNSEAFFIKSAQDLQSGFEDSHIALRYRGWGNPDREIKPQGIPHMVSPGKRKCGMATFDFGIDTVLVPYFIYQYYGNTAILESSYPFMKSWHNYMISFLKNSLLDGGLGDWCTTYGADCPTELSDSIWYYNEINKMMEISTILNLPKDTKMYTGQRVGVREEINKKYFDAERKFYKAKGDKDYASHTGCAMALKYGIVPPGQEKAVSDAIVKSSQENMHGFLNIGNFGIHTIWYALADFGNKEYAFKMLDKKGVNSFEYMWNTLGATTNWEGWVTHGRPTGGSQNHVFQGAYDQFFYERVAGLSMMPQFPGFKKTLFMPTMCEFFDFAKASVDTPYGLTVSDWKKENGKVTWTIIVPSNAMGEVVIPAGAKNPMLNGQVATSLGFGVPSGTYKITFDL